MEWKIVKTGERFEIYANGRPLNLDLSKEDLQDLYADIAEYLEFD